MTSIIKILRSIVPGNRPSGQSYGTPYVNFGDNQFGVFDSGNIARDLIGVPVFSSAATYAAAQAVSYQKQLYIALGAVAAGAFNPAQWAPVGAGSLKVPIIHIFTASGSYAPTAGILYSVLEAWGGGGGGGAAAASGNTSGGGAGGGGAGGYSKKTVTLAQIGGGLTVTIGAGGAGGPAGANPGGSGGDTSVGSLCIAKGGSGGGGITPALGFGPGGPGGVAGTGDITGTGAPGGWGYGSIATGTVIQATAGSGGSTSIGGGGRVAGYPGQPATGPGGGGGGGTSQNANPAYAGGNGWAGYVAITEYFQ
jgi:hypothetical protein